MATVGEIAITVGADVGPMVREFAKGENALKNFGNSGSKIGGILGTAMGKAVVGIGAAAAAVVALTTVSMANIDVISKQARALGLSVASFQAMAMVAEEAGVESDKLSKLLIKMQDNIASLQGGTKAQVDQFAALGVSMADLAGLGADEQFALIAEKLAAITDPAEKTAAALNVFGKSGADAITMFDGYGAAAAEAAAFQQQFGIAVSDLDAQNIEAANDAMGRLGMAASGLGNILAAALAPAIEATANSLVTMAEYLFGVRTEVEEFFGSLEEAKAILGEDVFNRMIGNPEEIARSAETLDAINVEAQRLIGIAANLEGGIRSFAAGLDMIGESGAASAVEAIADEAAHVREEFDAGRIPAEEFLDRMIGIQERAQDIVTEMANINGSDFGGVIANLGGLGTALAEALAKALELRAALPGGATDFRAIPDDRAAAIAEGQSGLGGWDGAVTTSPRPQSAPTDPDFGIPGSGTGAGTGASGGGSNPMTARIEALVASLQTEREIIAAWYEESLATLQTATEAELAAVGGKHEALERLEEEHQQRLASIREMGNQWGLDAALGGAAEILGALGQHNKKALKMAKAFSAAQALISTYEGAAKELKKGTFGFASAAAVIAKGLAFVATIRSTSEGGGGGSRSGGGAAAAAPQTPAQTMNFTITNDPFGYGERFARSIAEQMNAARRNGSQIVATVTST